jgi:hypothetical protein
MASPANRRTTSPNAKLAVPRTYSSAGTGTATPVLIPAPPTTAETLPGSGCPMPDNTSKIWFRKDQSCLGMLTCGKCHDLMDAPCQGATSVPAVTKKQRIIDDVTADIREGRLKTGDQLPTTPAFVARYDVPGAGIFVT